MDSLSDVIAIIILLVRMFFLALTLAAELSKSFANSLISLSMGVRFMRFSEEPSQSQSVASTFRGGRIPAMAKDVLNTALWERFEEAARLRRRDPVRLLKGFMKERLEVWEDQKLDRQLKKAARVSGRREEDAVDIVRRHRSNRNGPRASS